MSPIIVVLLLVLAMLLPIIGAVLLRLFGARMPRQAAIALAVVTVALPIVSAIVLSRANIPSLRVAGVTVLLAEPAQAAPLSPEVLELMTVGPDPEDSLEAATAPALATEETAPTAAAAPTTAPTLAPTLEPTALPTDEPTAVPPTPEPPTATPEPTPAPPPPAPQRRTYTVQQGDTLRGIAERFGVSVQAIIEANNLTAAQADALRPGQELVIP